MDAYVDIARTSHSVHVQIKIGNIINDNSDVVVVFRSALNGVTELADSERVLQAAGDEVEAEYQRVKEEGGRLVSKGVVLTHAGSLRHSQHILHLHIDQETLPWRRHETIISGLRHVDRQGLASIAFSPLPTSLQSDVMNLRLFESFVDFVVKYRPINLHLIRVVKDSAADNEALHYHQVNRFTSEGREVLRLRDIARTLHMIGDNLEDSPAPIPLGRRIRVTLHAFWPLVRYGTLQTFRAVVALDPQLPICVLRCFLGPFPQYYVFHLNL